MATEAQDHPNRPSTHLRINAFTHLRAHKAQPAQNAQTINQCRSRRFASGEIRRRMAETLNYELFTTKNA